MMPHRFIAELVGNEGPRRCGIRHRLDRGEGLRCDDEERGLRIEEFERIGDMGAIDIGNEMRARAVVEGRQRRSEEHTSELQSLMRISYAVFCLKKKKYTYVRKIEARHRNSNQ